MWDVVCKWNLHQFREKTTDIHRQTPLKLIFLKEQNDEFVQVFSF